MSNFETGSEGWNLPIETGGDEVAGPRITTDIIKVVKGMATREPEAIGYYATITNDTNGMQTFLRLRDSRQTEAETWVEHIRENDNTYRGGGFIHATVVAFPNEPARLLHYEQIINVAECLADCPQTGAPSSTYNPRIILDAFSHYSLHRDFINGVFLGFSRNDWLDEMPATAAEVLLEDLIRIRQRPHWL